MPGVDPYAQSAGAYPSGQGQYEQPTYEQPQYGQPQYGQPQYGQPQYGQPQYGQPQYGQPAYAGQAVPYGAGYPAYHPVTGQPLSDKSKIVAGILQLFLGFFGAGRFYTGHTGMAVAQLLVSVFTCGIGSIWGLIDGIIILVNGGTDAQGRVLRDS
jgi:TM2 domain-containing membrane protein YozV